ncbi:putative DNA-binding domain-containing protein [Shewanella avicenniae]|uniref:DNA-binding domain-containing protein n=1 Tax=Shewanella avicenniae TaxID=2814294 RepID=A0ABX7QPC3_9GAMM|nr:putative DNA-binding domain-containing protein [Shewanella avicenniae]QSX33318.1 putative DNA-binding domain-containing protein [Shewanella avicenniae]
MPANPQDFRAQQYQLAAHLRDSSQPIDSRLDKRRVAVYRELTRNNIYGFIDSTFPLCRQILADEWPQLQDEFVRCHRCTSPLFLDIPAAFVEFMQQHYPDGISNKPFINELLHYEWLELDIATKPAASLAPLPLTGTADIAHATLQCFDAAIAISYRYPVQQISVTQQPQQLPEQPSHLLLYRDEDDEVTFMAISAPLVIALNLLSQSRGLTLEQWLNQLAELCPQIPIELLTQGLVAILPSLSERGIIGLAAGAALI